MAVVVAREDQPENRQLVAYFVPRTTASAPTNDLTVAEQPQETLAAELRAYLQEHLPTYMVPATFELLARLPLTPNGKLDRQALPAPDATGHDRKHEVVAPRTPLEERVVDLWAEALGLKQVGIDDNFFDFGGHSLQAVQLTTRLSALMERRVSVRDLFLYPTVATLMPVLQQRPPLDGLSDQDRSTTKPRSLQQHPAPGLTIEHRPLLPLFETYEIAPVNAAVFSYLSTANIEPGPMESATLGRAEVLREWYHNAPTVDEVLTTDVGRVAIITLPFFDDQLYVDRSRLIGSMIEGLELAAWIGAGVVSLAGLLPSATNYGSDLTVAADGRPDLPRITTGHATTAATVVMAIRRVLAESERGFDHETVGLLGLGSIGRATLHLALRCLPHPRELILCDLYRKHGDLVRLKQELIDVFDFRGLIHIVDVPGQVPPEFYRATTIIGATNVPDVLDIGRVNPGTLIVDDSDPHCFNVSDAITRFEQHRDILFTEGGVLHLPHVISSVRYVPPLLEQALPEAYRAMLRWYQPNEMTGCIFSSLLTAQFTRMRPTLGDIHVDTSTQHYLMLEELGIQGARLHCSNYVLGQSAIEYFRQHHGP